jgi:hypothetical protein
VLQKVLECTETQTTVVPEQHHSLVIAGGELEERAALHL